MTTTVVVEYKNEARLVSYCLVMWYAGGESITLSTYMCGSMPKGDICCSITHQWLRPSPVGTYYALLSYHVCSQFTLIRTSHVNDNLQFSSSSTSNRLQLNFDQMLFKWGCPRHDTS